MTREEKIARARELRDEGWTYRAIGVELGVAYTTARRWIDLEAAEQDRERSRATKERYRGICTACGAPTNGSAGLGRASDTCAACTRQRQHDERRWTPDAIVEAMRSWATEHGYQPLVRDWKRAGENHPSETTVDRECGTWNAALRLAGFEPIRDFNRPFEADPTVPSRAAAMYRAGHTLAEVGTAFGVSPNRVGQWLDKIGVPRRSPHESQALREAREQVAA